MARQSLVTAFAAFTLLVPALGECEPEYQKFLAQFRKTSSPERREIFCANLERMQEINEAKWGFQVGWNERSDWTQEEVMGLLGALPLDWNSTEVKKTLWTPPANFVPAAASDWRPHYYGVKNQGRCGSCWAFASIDLVDFWTGSSHSEQQLVDCSGAGCGGGLPVNALNYLARAGSTSEGYYPYRAAGGYCQLAGKPIVAQVWNVRTTYGENNIAALLSQEPVAVCIQGGDGFAFQTYRSGIFNQGCGNPNHGHAIGAVGYGPGYWIIRNSWGAGWGQGGYGYFQRGANLCNIGTYCPTAAWARLASEEPFPLNRPTPGTPNLVV